MYFSFFLDNSIQNAPVQQTPLPPAGGPQQSPPPQQQEVPINPGQSGSEASSAAPAEVQPESSPSTP